MEDILKQGYDKARRRVRQVACSFVEQIFFNILRGNDGRDAGKTHIDVL